MEIVSLFIGEERRSCGVETREEIQERSRELAMGDGWGQRVRGSVEELRAAGARENPYGAWSIRIDSGELPCEVEG